MHYALTFWLRKFVAVIWVLQEAAGCNVCSHKWPTQQEQACEVIKCRIGTQVGNQRVLCLHFPENVLLSMLVAVGVSPKDEFVMLVCFSCFSF